MEKDIDSDISDFIEVCRVGAKIREESKKLIMIGESLLDIAETIEQMIRDEGFEPAFPVNISVNQIAAHFTPDIDSKEVLTENDVVKIDIGVSYNGAISDTAYTIDLSEKYDSLLEASREALNKAISMMKPGVKVGEIGGKIEETIRSYGFKPISNLTGHKIERWTLHAGVEIPNVKNNDDYELKEGDIFAVEPFSTDGGGMVSDLDDVRIYALYFPNPIRMRQSRRILQYIIDNYKTLPFAERWLHKAFGSKLLVNSALRELVKNQVLQAYPILKEIDDGIVAQFEHTVLIEEKGARILTK